MSTDTSICKGVTDVSQFPVKLHAGNCKSGFDKEEEAHSSVGGQKSVTQHVLVSGEALVGETQRHEGSDE